MKLKLPWVSRELLEDRFRTHIDIVTEQNTTITELRAALALERQRYDALLDRFLNGTAGTVSTAVATAPGWPVRVGTEAAPPFPAAESDELKALIDVRCGRDYRRRAMMLAQLATDRAAGIAPDQIKAAILNGVQSDGVPL